MRPAPGLAAKTRALPVFACALLLLCCLLACQAGAQGTATSLLLPSALVFDPQGNLFFAETGSHLVRRFSVSGVLATVAGTGVQGFSGDGGPATSAQLDSPAGLALDSSGNLYIADTHNHRIRKLSAATGLIVTIAGTGVPGFSGDGAPATAARLDLPTALALDTSGNLYLADTANHRVRKLTAATGILTTVAGNGAQGFSGDGGPAIAAALDSPNGLALDSSGNLYIADTRNARVRLVSASTGLISTIAGAGLTGGNLQSYSGDGGPATVAGLALPRGLAMDSSGNLFVADTANHRVRRISSTGLIATVAGQGTENFAGDGAPAVLANLDSPRAVALNPANLLTLSDTANQRIRQLDALPAPGPDIHTLAGLGASAADALTITGPSATTYGSGSLTAALNATGAATGSIAFLDTISGSSVTLASVALAANAAAFSTASLNAGTHTIVATYPGDASHAAAQSPAFPLTIARAPTLTTLSASTLAPTPGQTITLTITAASTTSGVPTGTVTLLDGTIPFASAPLSAGSASISTSALGTGAHTLTAAYAGDTNFLPSTSSAASLTVGPQSDFTLAPNGSASQSVPAGSAATFQFSVTMQGSPIASPINLAVQGAPANATVSLSPTYLPPGGAVTSFSLTIQVPMAQLDGLPAPSKPRAPLLAALLCLPLIGLAGLRKRGRIAIALAASVFLPIGLTGCGNRINALSASSVTQNYTLTVTGTATSPAGSLLQHSATVTLQVIQPG